MTSGVSLLTTSVSSGRLRSRATSPHILLFLVPSPSYLSSLAISVHAPAVVLALRRSSSSPPERMSSENLKDEAVFFQLACERFESVCSSPPVGVSSGGIGKPFFSRISGDMLSRLASSGLCCRSHDGTLPSMSSGVSRALILSLGSYTFSGSAFAPNVPRFLRFWAT